MESTPHPKTFLSCNACNKKTPAHDLVHSDLVSSVIHDFIQRDYKDWSSNSIICRDCLSRYRAEYIEDILQQEKGELSSIEQQVISSLAEQDTLSENINTAFDGNLTVGDKLSDKLAEFGGSWKFIIIFGLVLTIWIGVNLLYASKAFDPYPFILLNLVLSSIAALQAPVIMMSQNRQEAKDRLRSEYDYRINLKAELEIQHINLKIDQLLMHQWQRLLEIQRIQMELLEELAKRKG